MLSQFQIQYPPQRRSSDHTVTNSDYALANCVLHSNQPNRDAAPTATPFVSPSTPRLFAVFENAVALYRPRLFRCRGPGLFSVREIKIEIADSGTTHLLCAFKLERATDTAEKYSHQLRVTFQFQCIGWTRPGRNSWSNLDSTKEKTMSDSSLNLRTLLSLPDPATTSPPSNDWKEFQSRLGREIKTIQWPAAMPDLASKITELFDIELPGLLVPAWEKAKELQEALEESKKSPDEVIVLNLAEHEVNNEYHPYIEIRIAGDAVAEKD